MICDKCEETKKTWGDYPYPMYGVAPHIHDFSKTGSIIGSTRIKSKSEWPESFVEDPEAPGCGVYYCQNEECEFHKNNYNVVKDYER